MIKKRNNDTLTRNYDNKLLNENTPFAITEAFKTLRTNLFYTTNNEICPVYGITSAFAHAGKSVIISNLAVSYAQLNRHILLIDGDMRCPVIHKLFWRKNRHGLSELLAGAKSNDEWYRDFITPSGIDNLDLITSGHIPPNPSELLASDRMKEFIVEAKKSYDIIFIDMPPICEVSDAGVLAGNITGYIFTVRSNVTDSRAVTEALETLNQMNAHVIGFVLNDVNLKYNMGYNGKYSKYGKYGNKYGYTRNYEQESTNIHDEQKKEDSKSE